MTIYMKIPYIDGSVTTQGYERWIELDDFEFTGVSQSTSNVIGKVQNRIVGNPRYGKFHIFKKPDKSSITLFERAGNGLALSQVDIHLLTTGNPPFAYSKYTLKNVLVSHYSEDYKTGECITLNYGSIQKTFIPRPANNKPGSPLISGYDLATAAKM